MVPETKSYTEARLRRTLLIGLCVSAALLLSALLVALRTVHQIERDTQLFADRQAQTKSAIDDIETEQAELNSRWLQLAKKSDVVRRETILDQIAQSRQQMSSALESAYEQTEMLRESVYQEGHGLLRWTVWVFAACIALFLLCATWTVRTSAALFRRLELQATQLTQMQFQFLETQEEIARRFSHELHDELGQVLTAVKANLSGLRGSADDARVRDCMGLVDQAIKDVREMSQLLRPTILDDFGLDAALRSLSESFSQRTGIQVKYESDMPEKRFRDEAETSLFRIAQEALTNVARHAQATIVWIELQLKGNEICLNIRDNGHGFDPGVPSANRGLGLAGMETRARGCGGRIRVNAAAGKGLDIEVTCPAG